MYYSLLLSFFKFEDTLFNKELENVCKAVEKINK